MGLAGVVWPVREAHRMEQRKAGLMDAKPVYMCNVCEETAAISPVAPAVVDCSTDSGPARLCQFHRCFHDGRFIYETYEAS